MRKVFILGMTIAEVILFAILIYLLLNKNKK
jgi:hypothetical protein